MINGFNSTSAHGYSLITTILLGFMLVFGLSGCSSGGGDDEVAADPKGYYTGTASVKESDNSTDLIISDLQGMVSGNRFMFMSVNQVLLYDGTITDINGDSYIATVNIYKDGALLRTATVGGSITSASSITGTFTGQGEGNGTFSLTYSLNNADSGLTRIAGEWQGPLNGQSTESLNTTISSLGEVTRSGIYLVGYPVLGGCTIDPNSRVEPITGVNVYNLTLSLTNCNNTNVNGDYSGYITTQTVSDDILVIAYTNGQFSASGDMPIN